MSPFAGPVRVCFDTWSGLHGLRFDVVTVLCGLWIPLCGRNDEMGGGFMNDLSFTQDEREGLFVLD